MAICKNCNTQVTGDSKFCPNCGAAVEAQAASQSDFVSKVTALNDTADTTANFDVMDISNNKIMAIFAYIGILVLIPLLGAKDSKFARFHANQGLVLLVASIAWSLITLILGPIPVIDIIIAVAGWIVSVIFLVLMIIGIVNVCNGKAKELPVIGKFTILK